MYYSVMDDGGYQVCDIEENTNVTDAVLLASNYSLPDNSNREVLKEPITLQGTKDDHEIKTYQMPYEQSVVSVKLWYDEIEDQYH